MKKVLTKSFWEGVKWTFDEAREGPTTKDNNSQTPAEGDLSASMPGTPPEPSVSG